MNHWFPGLAEHKTLPLDGINPLTSVWLGNQSRIAAHYDFPQNLACNAVGHRTFTLFPPEQISQFISGPYGVCARWSGCQHGGFCRALTLNVSRNLPKPCSMHSVARLEPGDVLFIPSMWWHHVEACDAFNVLISHLVARYASLFGPAQ